MTSLTSHIPLNPTLIDGTIYFDDINSITQPTNKSSLKAIYKIGTKGIFDPIQFFKPAFVNATGITTLYQLLDALDDTPNDRYPFSNLHRLLLGYRNYEAYLDGSYSYYPDRTPHQDRYSQAIKRDFSDFDLLSWLTASTTTVFDQDEYNRWREGGGVGTFFTHGVGRTRSPSAPKIMLCPAVAVGSPTYRGSLPVDYFRFRTHMPPEIESSGAGRVSFDGLVAASIMNYSTDATSVLRSFRKNDAEYVGKDDFASFFGIELEVCSQISPAELQYIVQRMEPVQEPFFVMKSDGSISGGYRHKYEIVTIPMSYGKHKQEWQTLFKKLEKLCEQDNKTLADVFYATDSTGLHVHLSKSAFSASHPVLKKLGRTWQTRFLAAFNTDYKDEVDILTRVSKRQYKDNRYCGITGSPLYGKRMSFRIGADKASAYTTKYSPAHSNKPKTVEVRIFAGLVTYEHVMTSLELVKGMFFFSAEHGGPSCVRFGKKFKDWLFTQPGYTHLKKEFK